MSELKRTKHYFKRNHVFFFFFEYVGFFLLEIFSMFQTYTQNSLNTGQYSRNTCQLHVLISEKC